MKSGLASKLAAVGAGAAMLATMTAGLLATPAAAASGPKTHKAKAAVSVGTPKVSLSNYRGDCPVKVTFTTKIKVKVADGKTKVAYRWLRGNGSASSVKSFTVGKGVKYVTVKETHKIGSDTKGWEALQVLAPYKKTSQKSYFKVSCDDGYKHEIEDPRVYTKAWVDEGNCKARLVGRISTSGHRWVHYRWLVNGHVVDRGTVKVHGSTTVSHLIRTRDSLRGWAVLQVVDPYHTSSNKVGFKIWCKDWHKPGRDWHKPGKDWHRPGKPHAPKPDALVKVGHVSVNHTAAECPQANVTAAGSIYSSGPAKVRYEWVVNGKAVGGGHLTFDGSGTKTVSYSGASDGLKGGVVELRVDGDSKSGSYGAACAAPEKPADKTEDKPAPAPEASETKAPGA
ncbi:hypothetical protein GCM10010466_16480 [Planomonospora alba]|uniref:Ig-like domain-containing protein n=1 Tax=Planomonospora alba TaxID=161354 RepID=A0ABP6MUA8_9ACTN